MEFWGEEVKPGKTVSCEVAHGYVTHLSQVALGQTKKESENVVVSVEIGDKKYVIGTLSADKHPHISCDLIFDGDFELSHSSKNASVFLTGYTSVMPDMFGSESGEDEDEEMEADENPVMNNKTENAAANVPAKDDKKNQPDESETSSDSEDDSMSEDDSSDEDDVSDGSDDLSDDSEDDSDSEDETPVPEVGKKRASMTGLKEPSDKKIKISTPEKGTGSKKGVHIATPHPAKHASKTPADGKLMEKAPKTPADSKPKEKAPKTPAQSKAKENSPKSGSHSCKSCSKSFGSAGALESHQKAKNH